MESKSARKQSKKKIWIVSAAVLILAAIGIALFLPYIQGQTKYSNLDLSHVQEILYVEYEGEPFVTSVEKIYVFENKADLANFIETLQNGTFVLREPEGEDQGVFFIKGEESYNGVLRGSNLGFQYGDFWVQIKDITEWLDNMEEKPLVEVRDL